MLENLMMIILCVCVCVVQGFPAAAAVAYCFLHPVSKLEEVNFTFSRCRLPKNELDAIKKVKAIFFCAPPPPTHRTLNSILIIYMWIVDSVFPSTACGFCTIFLLCQPV